MEDEMKALFTEHSKRLDEVRAVATEAVKLSRSSQVELADVRAQLRSVQAGLDKLLKTVSNGDGLVHRVTRLEGRLEGVARDFTVHEEKSDSDKLTARQRVWAVILALLSAAIGFGLPKAITAILG